MLAVVPAAQSTTGMLTKKQNMTAKPADDTTHSDLLTCITALSETMGLGSEFTAANSAVKSAAALGRRLEQEQAEEEVELEGRRLGIMDTVGDIAKAVAGAADVQTAIQACLAAIGAPPELLGAAGAIGDVAGTVGDIAGALGRRRLAEAKPKKEYSLIEVLSDLKKVGGLADSKPFKEGVALGNSLNGFMANKSQTISEKLAASLNRTENNANAAGGTHAVLCKMKDLLASMKAQGVFGNAADLHEASKVAAGAYDAASAGPVDAANKVQGMLLELQPKIDSMIEITTVVNEFLAKPHGLPEIGATLDGFLKNGSVASLAANIKGFGDTAVDNLKNATGMLSATANTVDSFTSQSALLGGKSWESLSPSNLLAEAEKFYKQVLALTGGKPPDFSALGSLIPDLDTSGLSSVAHDVGGLLGRRLADEDPNDGTNGEGSMALANQLAGMAEPLQELMLSIQPLNVACASQLAKPITSEKIVADVAPAVVKASKAIEMPIQVLDLASPEAMQTCLDDAQCVSLATQTLAAQLKALVRLDSAMQSSVKISKEADSISMRAILMSEFGPSTVSSLEVATAWGDALTSNSSMKHQFEHGYCNQLKITGVDANSKPFPGWFTANCDCNCVAEGHQTGRRLAEGPPAAAATLSSVLAHAAPLADNMNNLGQGLGSMALQADQHMAQVETQKQQLLGGLKSFKAGVSQLDSALKSVGDDKALKAVDELLNKSSSVKELASNAGGLLGSLSGQMNDTWQGTARKLGEVANGGEVSETPGGTAKKLPPITSCPSFESGDPALLPELESAFNEIMLLLQSKEVPRAAAHVTQASKCTDVNSTSANGTLANGALANGVSACGSGNSSALSREDFIMAGGLGSPANMGIVMPRASCFIKQASEFLASSHKFIEAPMKAYKESMEVGKWANENSTNATAYASSTEIVVAGRRLQVDKVALQVAGSIVCPQLASGRRLGLFDAVGGALGGIVGNALNCPDHPPSPPTPPTVPPPPFDPPQPPSPPSPPGAPPLPPALPPYPPPRWLCDPNEPCQPCFTVEGIARDIYNNLMFPVRPQAQA